MSDRLYWESRRAKPGKGKLKRVLIDELRMIEREITHHIIAHVGGRDSAQYAKWQEAEERKTRIIADLEHATKESK